MSKVDYMFRAALALMAMTAILAVLAIAGLLLAPTAEAQEMCAGTELKPEQTCETVTGVPLSVTVQVAQPSTWFLEMPDTACVDEEILGTIRENYPARYSTVYGDAASLGGAESKIRAAFEAVNPGCWLYGLPEWEGDAGVDQYSYRITGTGTQGCPSGNWNRWIQPICHHVTNIQVPGVLDHQGSGDDSCVTNPGATTAVSMIDEWALVHSAIHDSENPRAISVTYVRWENGYCEMAQDGVRLQ